MKSVRKNIKSWKISDQLLKDSGIKNSTMISNIQGMIYRCKNDKHWSMEYVSDGCFNLTGYLPQDFINNKAIDFESLIDSEFRDQLREKWNESILNNSIFENEYLINTKSGEKKWVLERAHGVYRNNGSLDFLEGIITDITKIKINEEKFSEYYEKLYATLVSVGDGVITTDIKGQIELMNPVSESITGWSKEEACGKNFDIIFKIINENTRETSESPVGKVFESKSVVELTNHTLLIAKDGRETSIENTAAPILNKNGELIGSVVIFRDNTEKHERNKYIEHISYHDYLTGLYNRRFFEEELKKLDGKDNYPLSIMLVDVNGLKLINDAFGHNAGDYLIKKVAHILTQNCRQNDIVARYGGDEFIILLPQTNEEISDMLLKRVCSAFEEENIMNLKISVSMGYDTKYDDSKSIADTINNAENFLYKRKVLENLSKRNSVIKSIMNTLMVKNNREEEHSQRVSMFCQKIGMAYNMDSYELKKLKAAGELHDIGKIAVDDSVLNKPASLSNDEWSQIKRHPDIGYRILSAANEFMEISELIMCHHERWDGKGYPRGLKGEEIPFQSRIIAISDAYDAMTSDRSYRKALPKEDAILEMKKNAGLQFDPEMVEVFINLVLSAEI